jgi:hypothetical protein
MPTSVASQSGRAAPVKTKAKKGMNLLDFFGMPKSNPLPTKEQGQELEPRSDVAPVGAPPTTPIASAPVLSVQEQQSTEKRNDNHKPHGKTPSKQKLVQAKPKPKYSIGTRIKKVIVMCV